MVIRLASVAIVLVTGISLAAPAQALPLAPIPGSDLSVISATNYVVPDEFEATRALDAFLCPDPTPMPERSITLSAALKRADQVLVLNSSAAARRAFASSSMARSAPQAEAAFALSIMNRRPTGALAASLRLARLSPSPRHLVNSAVLLSDLGAADVAFDLLTWAKEKPLGIMSGVDGEAAWQSAMGAVLLELGQFQDAQAAYAIALDREPLMATARQGVARALKCQGDDDAARAWQGRSQSIIDQEIVITPGEDGNPPTWSAPGIPGVIDLSLGKKAPRFGPFVPPPIPNIPKGGFTVPVAEDWGVYLERTLQGVPEPKLTGTQRQFLDHVEHVMETDPGMLQLAREQEDLNEQLLSLPGESSCAAVDHFGAYWNWVSNNYDLSRRVAERSYLIYTAAAAHTGDPAFNKYLNDFAAFYVDATYAGFLYGLLNYADVAEVHAQYVRDDDANPDYDDPSCQASFGAAPPSTKYTPGGPEGDGERSSPCKGLGPLAKKDLLTISIPIPGSPIKPKLKVNCERISLSAKFASLGGPYADMGLFASADFEWASSDIVLFTGAFWELGPLGVKAGPSVRFGSDAQGNFGVKDFAFTVKAPPGLPRTAINRAGRPTSTTWLLIH
jgi:hypothetical protein